MTLTYINLVNEVLRDFKEVQATAASFINTTDTFQQSAKDAVNKAISEINSREIEWPFNASAATIMCSTGTAIYDLDSVTKYLDWHAFQVQKDDTIGNNTRHLILIPYDEWIDNWSRIDGDATSGASFQIPRYVYRTPENKVGLSPKPDASYTITYPIYKYPTILNNHSDVTEIPDMFKYVIVAGAGMHMANIRSDVEGTSEYKNRFISGIKDMEKILIGSVNIRVRDSRTRFAKRRVVRRGGIYI